LGSGNPASPWAGLNLPTSSPPLGGGPYAQLAAINGLTKAMANPTALNGAQLYQALQALQASNDAASSRSGEDLFNQAKGITNPADLEQFLASLRPEDIAALQNYIGNQSKLWNPKTDSWANPDAHASAKDPLHGRGAQLNQIGGRIKGTEQPNEPVNTSSTPPPDGSTQGRLAKAIAGQESGGSYGAVNPHSGALGKYQVMPNNVASWSKAAGFDPPLTPQQFLKDPQAQEKVVSNQLGKYFQEGMAKSNNTDTAVRYAAAKWYSGNGNKWNDTTPQSYAGHSYPSIASYTASVLQRFQKAT
jgi:hypothetical protein